MTQPSLTDFLTARLAEGEAVARDQGADAMTGHRWKHFPRDAYEEIQALTLTASRRVLADVEAKRARLRLADEIEDEADDGTYRWAASIAERIRRIEALPFADHPDYRAEWRP